MPRHIHVIELFREGLPSGKTICVNIVINSETCLEIDNRRLDEVGVDYNLLESVLAAIDANKGAQNEG